MYILHVMIIVISKNIATLRLETISLEWLTGAFVGCLKFLKELVSFNLSESCQSTNNNNIIIKICIAPTQVLLLALHKRLTLKVFKLSHEQMLSCKLF